MSNYLNKARVALQNWVTPEEPNATFREYIGDGEHPFGNKDHQKDMITFCTILATVLIAAHFTGAFL